MSETSEPFSVHVSDVVLDDLKARLRMARWPDQVGADWVYGTPLSYLRTLCDYWRDGFDWRTQEAKLNAFTQFTMPIEDEQLHYIHQRSPERNAVPLLLSHGWPGSIAEFMKVIAPLTDPRAHGGDPNDAFHVIAPSIPGYGFSQAPRQPGFDARACARRFAALMARLGYGKYFAQGGDWGSAISTWLAADHAPLRVLNGPETRSAFITKITNLDQKRPECVESAFPLVISVSCYVVRLTHSGNTDTIG